MQAGSKKNAGQAEAFTEREKKLIKLIREVGFGELRIFITEGQPVRAEEVKKSIKL